jgi:peptidoglycan-associated lipoprotein
MNRSYFKLKRASIAFTSAALLAAVLAGCGSSVPLKEAPVEDKAATSSPSGPAGQSSVAPVDLTSQTGNANGPMNVERIIYFDFDSYIIKPEFQQVLDAHARYLKAAPGRKVMLEGHTDERGGREYNLALGQKRAEAVRRALGLLGVPDNQMEAVSFGKEKPAVQGNTEEAYAKNRRVELSYR